MSLIPGETQDCSGTQEPQPHIHNLPVKHQHLGIRLQGLLAWNLLPKESIRWDFGSGFGAPSVPNSKFSWHCLDGNFTILMSVLGSFLLALLGFGDAPWGQHMNTSIPEVWRN